jgi:hypothetical protein
MILPEDLADMVALKDFWVSNSRTVVGAFVHSRWTALNIRCKKGKYTRYRTKNKCKIYENIEIRFTREEFKSWCWDNQQLIESITRPSIDRIDSKGHYELSNIRIIPLLDNISNKRMGNTYTNGPKSKIKRGIRKSGDKFGARIHIQQREYHLGTFDTEDKAYTVYRETYNEWYGKYPW